MHLCLSEASDRDLWRFGLVGVCAWSVVLGACCRHHVSGRLGGLGRLAEAWGMLGECFGEAWGGYGRFRNASGRLGEASGHV